MISNIQALIIRFGVDIALFILIWLVQVIIYPSFKYADASQFDFWHSRYMQLITYFVGPLMLLQVGIVGWQLFQDFKMLYLVSALSIGLVWIITALISIPCHTKLVASGFDMVTIHALINTNWYRTILWSIVLLISSWQMFQIFGKTTALHR